MDLGSIFLLLAVLVGVIVIVARPLMLHTGQIVSEQEHIYSGLLAERDQVLDALKELEFDHILGKIPEEDYPEQRSALMRAAADIYQKLDAAQPQGKKGKKSASDSELESKIAARRAQRDAETQSRQARFVTAPDDELEAMIAARKREKEDRREITAGFCSQCGAPIHRTDKFCSKCGNALHGER